MENEEKMAPSAEELEKAEADTKAAEAA